MSVTQPRDTVDPRPAPGIPVLDKATGDVLGVVPAQTAGDVEDALTRARRGFLRWSELPLHRRAAALHAFAHEVDSRRQSLARLLARENGKVLADALIEVDTTARIFRGFAEESVRLFGQTIPLDRQEGLEADLLITRHEPLGVVAAILAFNFPAELFAHKVGAALAGGNAVVVKLPEPDPLTCLALVDMLHSAGVPEDALIALTGGGEEVGGALSRSDRIDAISFTGSSRVGRIIAQNAAPNIVRTSLELSGNDAFIVAADADLPLAIAHAREGRRATNGQVCIATKRLFVAEPVLEEFCRRLAETVDGIAVGNPLDGDAELGPLISEDAARRVEEQVAAAVARGARPVRTGRREGRFFHPAVLVLGPDDPIATDEEIFGPVFSLIPVRDVEEGVDRANASAFGLNAAVFTSDVYAGIRAAARLQAGIVSLNGGNLYRPDGSSFGGYKRSGLGREGYLYSLHEFTQLKSIVLRGVFVPQHEHTR